MTSLILLGIDFTKFWKISRGIKFHSCTKVSHSSFVFLHFFLAILLFTIAHKFSMGFMSEDWGGQSNVLNLCFLSHARTHFDL